ncbi:hypothetical protein [Burkholderia sp. lig30]|jgi:hypothetical protein|uniref:hypothetical protein n=1 Tax=Burkholderia sp. lig30 TaxID=1192124 RepID=UPI000AAC4645|nr:hypothetical protein [Burkholderia sp. lig30]
MNEIIVRVIGRIEMTVYTQSMDSETGLRVEDLVIEDEKGCAAMTRVASAVDASAHHPGAHRAITRAPHGASRFIGRLGPSPLRQRFSRR